MRWMTIPADIELVDFVTERPLEQPPYSFRAFVLGALLADPQHFGVDHKAVCSCIEIRKLVRGAKPGDVIPLEREDWERLHNASRTPSVPFRPQVAAQIGVFFDAIAKAAEQKPEANGAAKDAAKDAPSRESLA